jgi:hypothetical protein
MLVQERSPKMSDVSAAMPPTSSPSMEGADLQATHLKALSHPIRWKLVWLLEQ